ncbi:SagB/ThcOx family dehydrogenase [Duganella violaceipulchra]|uniref:SagB-type dehydrogenase family enzyme n=1 Tax=Duganella violaceipulchra TaxID=2849652 RepID=A0AA41L0E8_9BURK|nr:SagB/ThcOx family dehydrogenase [Duganella violaceicalia]MBV6322631.1 SagB/ThcOx family dehydrogenase [Duganella violaceicalia]MCP2010844.1 SagB-type dehydrogenase family enzyme [Duganella violaceicalia]
MNHSLQELLPPQAMAGDFDIDDPAEILHEQTKFHRATLAGQVKNIVRYLRHPAFIARGAAGYNVFASCPKIDLPQPDLALGELAAAMAGRTSARGFAPSLSLREVSSLLHHAVRVNRYRSSDAAPHVKLAFRAYPSPGGLYPTEFYFFLNQVEGVAPCIAHYDARGHCLRVLKPQDGDAFGSAEVRGGEQSIKAPLVCVMTSVPQRATAKYGARGYRMALLEAGHASQNLCLAAQGLGMGSLVYGAYYDDELAALLDIDGVTETVVSVMLLGREAQQENAKP